MRPCSSFHRAQITSHIGRPGATRTVLPTLVGRLITNCVATHTLEVLIFKAGPQMLHSGATFSHLAYVHISIISPRQNFRSRVDRLVFGRIVDHSYAMGRPSNKIQSLSPRSTSVIKSLSLVDLRESLLCWVLFSD